MRIPQVPAGTDGTGEAAGVGAAGLSKPELADRGRLRVVRFCEANGLEPPPVVVVPRAEWVVSACAFYRPEGHPHAGIRVCLERCARPAREGDARNWNWPGSTTGREPFGVICHELGHHLDWTGSEVRGRYFGDLSSRVRAASGEPPLTSYCPDDAEWFAEMARLFVANHALLMIVRPRTWELLLERWAPVSGDDWEAELGDGVPPRVLTTLHRKIADARRGRLR